MLWHNLEESAVGKLSKSQRILVTKKLLFFETQDRQVAAVVMETAQLVLRQLKLFTVVS